MTDYLTCPTFGCDEPLRADRDVAPGEAIGFVCASGHGPDWNPAEVLRLHATIAGAGADVVLAPPPGPPGPWARIAEAWSRPVVVPLYVWVVAFIALIHDVVFTLAGLFL